MFFKKKAINIFIFGLACTVLTASCTGETSQNSSKDEKEFNTDWNVLEQFNLSPFDISASILLPNSLKPEIHHELDDFKWTITLTPDLQIFITDWGEKTVDDFIEKLKEEKAENFSVLDNLILYKSSKSSYYIEKGTVNAVFHTIKGVNYLFSAPVQNLSEEEIEFMQKIILSVETINSF